jgi:hypothetical protein
VKHLSMRFVGSVAGALALVASLAIAAVGTAGNETAAAPAPVKPPTVPNAKALKAKFGGTSLTFLGDGPVGKSHTRDQLLVAKFSKDTRPTRRPRTRSSPGRSPPSRRPST